MGAKQRRWFSVILFLLIVFLAGNYLVPKEWVTYTVEGDTLWVSCATSQAFQTKSEYSFSVSLDEITSYTMVDTDSDAVLLRGTKTKLHQAGLLESKQYGEFEGCLCQKSEQAVMLQTEDGHVYMVSLEDAASTAGFFAGFDDLMADY